MKNIKLEFFFVAVSDLRSKCIVEGLQRSRGTSCLWQNCLFEELQKKCTGEGNLQLNGRSMRKSLVVRGAGMKIIQLLQKGVRILCTSEYHITKWDVSTCLTCLLCIILRVSPVVHTNNCWCTSLSPRVSKGENSTPRGFSCHVLNSRRILPAYQSEKFYSCTFWTPFKIFKLEWRGLGGSNEVNLCIYTLVLCFKGSCNELLQANITGCFSAERSQMKWPFFHLLFFSTFELISFWRSIYQSYLWESHKFI